MDWFGFMAYDLHGPWDAGVTTIGSVIRPQTDIREIINDTLPLWYDSLDPAKINLGLAYYGRGFTLSDRSCSHIGCPFSGPSNPAPCTNFEGIMSNREIQRLIKEKTLTPTIIEGAQVKQITWEDQWIGYDDNDTLDEKVRLANSLCIGGTMIWSIDFDSGSGSGDVPDAIVGLSATHTSAGGGDNPGSGSSGNSGANSFNSIAGSGLVFIDQDVWKDSHPLVACEPPCVLVLPPVQLSKPTVISFPPLTTTYVINTHDTAGEEGGGAPIALTRTTAISIPLVTTTEIELWAVTFFTNDSTAAMITPTQSVEPPPITVTFTEHPDSTKTTITSGLQSTTGGIGILHSHQTIYLQPTYSIIAPSIPTISYTRGTPKASCTAHCGTHNCTLWGCGGGCGLFGCGGNCGMLACGGGCGLAGCGGSCGLVGCGGCGLSGCGTACPQCAPDIDTGAGRTSSDVDAEPDENEDNDDDDDDDEEDEDE